MRQTCRRQRLWILAATAWLVASFSAAAGAQSTTRVSVATGGAQANDSSGAPSISGNGRSVAFWSWASNLVPGDTNGQGDTFIRDLQTGTTERVSVATSGAQANGTSGGYRLGISFDGRFIAFSSSASNLVAGDTNGYEDAFLHDRLGDTTVRVSVATGGGQGNFGGAAPSISADGHVVAFASWSLNLVPGDTNGQGDIFIRDLQSGVTERASVATSGAQGNGPSEFPSISADGRFVAFTSSASNLVAGDTNNHEDVFLRDRMSGTTERLSVATSGAEANEGSRWPWISADGRFVAFESDASNLVPGDTNGHLDVFVHDRQTGMTERVSIETGGGQGNDRSWFPSISADGRFVTFGSNASNLVSGDTNDAGDAFVHDRQLGTTGRLSVASDGTQGNAGGGSTTISGDGRFVAFSSAASNLVPGDTNGRFDVFLRDRGAPSTTLCAGDGSGAPCGCGNEAAPGSGGGCANAAPMPAGQGARLTTSGSASVAADDLVLTVDFTTGQPGLFFQGQNAVAGGAGQTFGDGLRCCGGSVVRLEIVDPPGPAGPSSASTTQPILGTSPAGTTLPGDSRCYQWWYRNPGVSLCGSNFNLSNAVLVIWVP